MPVAERHEHATLQAPVRAAAVAATRPARPAVALHGARRAVHSGVPVDPSLSIAHAYRFERARRTLRSARRDERRRAARRFWLALAVLLVGVAAVAGATVSELQRLFGI